MLGNAGLINNRQGGRRRGRGGQGGRNPGQPGNRQDNRQRGNAAQLLEKYKSMARDAQLSGDRVQTEYYLQFADHYFRVLDDTRSRFEEQKRNRGDDSDDEDSGDEPELAEAEGDSDERQHAQQNRRGRSQRGSDRSEDKPEDQADDDGRRRGRSKRETAASDKPAANRTRRGNGETETLSIDALPPAIGRDSEDGSGEEKETRPRRRSRTDRSSNGDEDIAPAA